jgi:hypothetical protein
MTGDQEENMSYMYGFINHNIFLIFSYNLKSRNIRGFQVKLNHKK